MLQHVLSPINLGRVTVPNRIVRTGHGTMTRDGEGQISDRLIAYHEARARGGVGLTILETSTVHPRGASGGGLSVWDDRVVGKYQRLMERVAPTGMRVFQELGHQGRRAGNLVRPGLGASPVIGWDRALGVFEVLPEAMTQSDIDEVVESYAAAAVRARAGGLHGVELQTLYSIFHQFISPASNRRDDDYGGALPSRLRFLMETIAAVRAAIGPELALGVRVSADYDPMPGGLTVQDSIEIARAIESTGSVDYLSVAMGDQAHPHVTAAPMSAPPGYQLELTTRVTTSVSLPTIVAGRILTLEHAEQIIASERAQLVAMVRATIADPDLVRKTRNGLLARVRPCIGINEGCTGNLFRGKSLGCAVNASAGAEETLAESLIEPVAKPKRVLVAGGGPAGLEAARIAALRGHEVLLHEATECFGGQVALARRAPLRAEIGRIVDWLLSELEHLDVTVMASSRVTSLVVEQLRPDAVVVATGGRPARDGFQVARPYEPVAGADAPHVWTSWDVLGAPLPPGGTAVVLDEIGHYEAVAVADQLIDCGFSVQFVCRFGMLAPHLEPSLTAVPARARLGRAGVVVHPFSQLVSVLDGTAVIRNLDSGVETRVAIDAAVLVTPAVPDRTLTEQLAGYPGEVHVVGDARSPRFLMTAMHEAHLVARSI